MANEPEAHVPKKSHERHVILAGYGQVGREVGRSLREAGIEYAVIEINPETVRRLREEKTIPGVFYGDVANAEVLEAAGLKHADALILTMPDEPAVLAACATARRHRRDLFIVARLQLERHSRTAAELGADLLIVEELEAARAMRQAVVAHFSSQRGVSDAASAGSIATH